jgi:hypothetical protein
LITLTCGLLWLATGGAAAQNDGNLMDVERFTDGDALHGAALYKPYAGVATARMAGGAHTLHNARRGSHKKGIGSFPTDFCLRVDTGERLWSSSYDESSDSASLIRIGHRVAAAVERPGANPCGILHREKLVDAARRVTKADPCRGRGVAIALGCDDGWCDIAGSPVGAGRTGCRRVPRLHLGGLVSLLDSISGSPGARSSSGIPGWCAANVL